MYLKSKLVVRFAISKDAGKERGFPQWLCCGTPYTALVLFGELFDWQQELTVPFFRKRTNLAA
jgi:hypothetical protein